MSRVYPRKAEIERTVAAAKSCGVDVTAIEVSRDGTIRVSDDRRASSTASSEFDRLDAEGRL